MKRLMDSLYRATKFQQKTTDLDMSEEWQGWDAWVSIPPVSK